MIDKKTMWKIITVTMAALALSIVITAVGGGVMLVASLLPDTNTEEQDGEDKKAPTITALKQDVIGYLKEHDIEYKDFGCFDEQACDYPEYGKAVANAVASGECDKGIIICGTGIGISLAANKVPGIRCAVVSDVFSAKMSKAHNDANMLSLGERVLGRGLALEIVDAWINTEFEGDRHSKRVNMIKEIEERYNK